jgi:hypothetical protein
MTKAPDFDRSPLKPDQARAVANAFKSGAADHIPARALVRAGVARYYAMRGGIFWRREPVSYLVVHSTETGIPLDAKRVIDSWSSMGRRHPGAQYVVDRDGTIYQAVDPDLGTVHLNIFKTLPGINNDNSIGIEMVHTGRQPYTAEQRTAVICLVHYLQDRYKVSDDSVITHRFAQQGDHTDPVAFNWDNFLKDKQRFRTMAIAGRMSRMVDEAETAWQQEIPSATTTYLQIHTTLPPNPTLEASDSAGSDAWASERRSATAAGAITAEPEEPSDLLTVGSAPLPAMARQHGNSQSRPSASSASQPSLRGEIEVDPKTAGQLLRTPIETAVPGQERPGAVTPDWSESPEQAHSSPAGEQPAAPAAATSAAQPAETQPATAPQQPAAMPELAPGESPRDPEPLEYFIHQPTPVGQPLGQ